MHWGRCGLAEAIRPAMVAPGSRCHVGWLRAPNERVVRPPLYVDVVARVAENGGRPIPNVT